MRLRGTKTDGSAYLNNVAPGSAVGQLWIDNGYQNRGLTLADLRSLKDGSTLTIECKATLNTSTNENEALVFPVRTYTIKAFEVVTPTITRAEDSKNVEIPQGGITADTAVTLTGTASKGQKVQIFDGTTSKGEATAHLTSGIWTLVMTGLSLAAHSFTAKALYGAGQTSEPRTLTIQEANIPTFTNPPYVIAPAGRFKNIELVLRNGSTPVSGKIALTLPADFTYADGGSGTREFMTDANGLLSVSGIKGHTRPGAYTLTADSGFASATANMTITPQGGVGTIPTGSGAYGVAVSPDGTRVYACNSQTHTISVMDVITRTVIATIPVGDYPYGIAVSPDGTSAYVGSVMSNAVSVIDTVNLLVTKAIPVGSGSSWIVVSPDGTRAYASSTGGVSVIDTVNLAIIGTISLPVVGGIAVSPDGTRAYACSTGGVSVIDTVNLVVTWTIPTGTRPYWIAISPDGTRAYVSHSVANTVSVIDIVNLVMIRTISNVAYTQLISVSPDGTRAYVCNWRGDTVSVIDTVTFMVIRTIPVGANPVGIAVNPDGTRAYVGNQSSNFVSVIAVG
jgi:YVTN family beta-propeller protein